MGKLDTRSPSFGVSSDWPDLSDLCLQVMLECARSDSETVRVSDDIIAGSASDPQWTHSPVDTYGCPVDPVGHVSTVATTMDWT